MFVVLFSPPQNMYCIYFLLVAMMFGLGLCFMNRVTIGIVFGARTIGKLFRNLINSIHVLILIIILRGQVNG